MNTRTAKTRSGKQVYTIVLDSEFETAMEESGMGFCIACGGESYGVEPDARKYECEVCGECRVYGLEELVMMGYVR